MISFVRPLPQLVCLLILLWLNSPPIIAQEVPAEIDWLERIETLEAELQELRQTLATSQLDTDHSTNKSAVDSAPENEEIRYPTVTITGMFQADIGWISQDIANRQAVGDVQDGADFRRTRLAARGDVFENVGYEIEFDFAFSGRPSFMDVFLEIRDTEHFGNLRIGHYLQRIGLDGLTSARELTFIERGLPFAFLPFRQIGIMSYGSNDEQGTTWAISGFRFPTDQFGGQVGDDGGYALATRLTGLVIDAQEQGTVHVGTAYSLIDPANNAVRYRNAPEFFVAETGGAAFVRPGILSIFPPFVDTGVIPTDQSQLFTAEFAATRHALHAQAEMIYALVNRRGASTVGFYGVSAQLGWILTGEHRPYNRKNAVLDRIVPEKPFDGKGCGSGAWELAGRWSLLDLNDQDVEGGKLNNITFGVNWYLNEYTKFQLNYIHAFLETPGIGPSDADIVGLRAQVDF